MGTLVLALVSCLGLTSCVQAAIAQDASCGSVSLTGKNNQEKIYNFFISKNLKPEQAAGIVGNISVESAGTFSPSIIEGGGQGDPSHATSGGYGIVQWTPGTKFVQAMKAGGKSDDDIDDLGVQLEAIYSESIGKPDPSGLSYWTQGTTVGNSFNAVSQTSTVQDATSAWMNTFEHPNAQLANLSGRISAAQQTLKDFGNGSSGGGGGGGGGGSDGGCAVSGSAAAVLEWAVHGLGIPYDQEGNHNGITGANDCHTSGYKPSCRLPVEDCSGYARWVYWNALGVDIGTFTGSQMINAVGGKAHMKIISHGDAATLTSHTSELQPADLIMFGTPDGTYPNDTDHIVIYKGGGQLYAATTYGEVSHQEPIYNWSNHWFAIIRIVGLTSDA